MRAGGLDGTAVRSDPRDDIGMQQVPCLNKILLAVALQEVAHILNAVDAMVGIDVRLKHAAVQVIGNGGVQHHNGCVACQQCADGLQRRRIGQVQRYHGIHLLLVK